MSKSRPALKSWPVKSWSVVMASLSLVICHWSLVICPSFLIPRHLLTLTNDLFVHCSLHIVNGRVSFDLSWNFVGVGLVPLQG